MAPRVVTRNSGAFRGLTCCRHHCNKADGRAKHAIAATGSVIACSVGCADLPALGQTLTGRFGDPVKHGTGSVAVFAGGVPRTIVMRPNV